MQTCIDPEMRTMLHSYEMNQLSDAERDQFEEHLIDCPFCMDEVQSMARLSAAMIVHREAVLDALKTDGLTFDRIRRSLTTPRETIWDKLTGLFQGWQRRTALAGAVAAAILVTLLLRPPSTSLYRSDLSYDLPPYQLGVQLRGETQDEATRLFESAMKFYVEGDYGAAAQGIKHALRLDAGQAERWLYLGASQYALHDMKDAVKSLKRAERDGEGLTKTRAQWYLAQAYLYEGKVDRARVLLESVAAQDSERVEEARMLLSLISQRERQGK